jgi:anti-sigma factor RsiW
MPMRDIPCREIVEIVTDYIEGVMPARLRKRFEAHLAGCPGCQTYVEQMREVIARTGKLREEDVPPEVMERLLGTFRGWKR